MLYHYCVKLRRKLNNTTFQNKKIVHYTDADGEQRVNAAFLIGAYSVRNLRSILLILDIFILLIF